MLLTSWHCVLASVSEPFLHGHGAKRESLSCLQLPVPMWSLQSCVTLPHLVLGLLPGEKPMKVRGTLMSLNPRREQDVGGWQISIVRNSGNEVEPAGHAGAVVGGSNTKPIGSNRANPHHPLCFPFAL